MNDLGLFIDKLKDSYGQIMVYLFYDLKNLKKKIAGLERRQFLCQFFIAYNVLPSSARLKNKNLRNQFDSTITNLEWKLFKFNFRKLKNVLFNYKEKLDYYLDIAFKKLIEQDRINMMTILNNYKSFLDETNFKQISKKIKFLKTKWNLINNEVHQRKYDVNLECFINISDKIIPKHILTYLNKGPKHIMDIKYNKKDNFIDEMETEFVMQRIVQEELMEYNGDLRNLNLLQVNSLKKFKNTILKTDNKQTGKEDWKLCKNLKLFLQENKLTLIEADKSHTLIMVDISYYKIGMEQALLNNNFKKTNLNNNEKIERDIQKICRELKDRNLLDDIQYRKIYPSGCPNSKIKGKLKIHKENPVFRPIVDAARSCIKNLSQWVIKIVEKYCDKSTIVKNAKTFKDELSKIKIKDSYYMVSYDAIDMFSNINIKRVSDYILTKYRFDKNKVVTMPLQLLEDCLNVCTSGTTVVFEGELFEQTSGIGMGLPIASLYANIYMNILEKQLLKTNKYGIIKYARFMDDIFILLDDKIKSIGLLNKLNELSDDLKFTIEEEQNNRLNFLDVSIKREDEELIFSVCHKKYKNDIKINFFDKYSNHTIKNTLNQEILRAFNLCSNEKLLTTELNFIKEVYLKNDYPLDFINKSIKDVNKKFIKDRFTNNNIIKEDSTILVLDHTANLEIINNAFRNLKNEPYWNKLDNLKIIQKRKPSLGELMLPINKIGIPQDKMNNVVYEFGCSCEAKYVGCTKRNGYIRIKEHLRDKNSALNQHITKYPDHRLNENSFQILHKIDNKLKLQISESLFIKKLKPTLNLENGLNLFSYRL